MVKVMTGDRRSWPLEKSFSIGHMMTTAVTAFYMIWWASAADTRLAQTQESFKQYVEAQVKVIDAINARLEVIRLESDMKRTRIKAEIREDLNTFKTEIRSDLSHIDNKVDRLLEIKVQDKQQ